MLVEGLGLNLPFEILVVVLFLAALNMPSSCSWDVFTPLLRRAGFLCRKELRVFPGTFSKALVLLPLRAARVLLLQQMQIPSRLLPCHCGASLCVSQVEEPSHSHEEILSLSSLYTFNVWQALFSVAAEFLPCTALFVPPECWPFSAQGLSLTWHSALVFVLLCTLKAATTVVVIITGMQIYYLVFSNSVGAHVYLVHLSAVFK